MKTATLASLACALSLVMMAAAAPGEAPPPGKGAFNTTVDMPLTLAIADGDKPVAAYRYSGVPFKPYFKELHTPRGVNVLRDAPPDHLHHHALMFAIGIEKTDFWSETPGCGQEVHEAFPGSPSSTKMPEGGAVDRFTEALAWKAPGEEKPLAKEMRSVEIHRGGDLDATFLVWRTTLAAGGDRPSVKLFGSHYFGLGLRLPIPMEKATEFLSADPKAPRDNVRGDENVFPSKWLAAIGQVGGKPVTVAMFDGPDNARPVRWFTMADPFAYMSATLNLYKEPMTLEAGKPLALTYGVAACDGKKTAEEIEKLYQKWLGLLPLKK